MRRLAPLVMLAAGLLALPASAAATTNDPLRADQWNLDRIGAEAAWPVGTGAGVTVAVIDSGVDLHHEDLSGHLLPGHDFVDNDDDPQDAYGHGTHVAGIIGATAGNGRGVAGVAPGVKLLPVRVLDANGSGSLDNVVAGIRWAVAHGAKVLNLSLGEDTQSLLGPSFGDALREAWNAGAIPVVAAGNQFLTGSGFGDEPAMVVTATNRDNGKATYASGVGTAKWGIAAPGGELPNLGTSGAIVSTYWTGKQPNQYAYLAGTSQAAPHVSAALAILLSTGRFTPAQAVQRLLSTAHDLGSPGYDATFGAGLLDLAAATRGIAPAGGSTATTSTATVRPRAASATTSTAPAPAPSIAPSPVTPQAPPTIEPEPSTAVTPGRRVAIARAGGGSGSGGGGHSRTAPALLALAVLAAVALQLRHRLVVALGRSGRP